jgi:peptide/nickel transport system permease protein
MRNWILIRIGVSVALLVLSSILIFCLMRVIPGDPTITKVAASGHSTGADVRTLHAIKHQLGLDRPIPVQYLRWIGGALHGDFGKSYFSQFPVTTLISQRIGATLVLTGMALLLGMLVVLGFALVGAIWNNRQFGWLMSGFSAFGMATPAFITGILLIIVFGARLKLLPTQGYVSIEHHPLQSIKTTLLPAITLAIAIAAPLLRLLNASLDEVGSAPFIRTAAGKGLLRREVVLRHQLPNALLPTLTLFGVIIGSLLGGAVVVEFVFARPGLGTLMVDSIETRDYGVLQALVLLAAVAFILTSLAVDLAYGFIDPRLRRRTTEVA